VGWKNGGLMNLYFGRKLLMLGDETLRQTRMDKKIASMKMTSGQEWVRHRQLL